MNAINASRIVKLSTVTVFLTVGAFILASIVTIA